MKSTCKWTNTVWLGMALLVASNVAVAYAAPRSPQAASPYTIAEYNAYKAADTATDPQQRIKLLDDFVKQYSTPSLMQYIYTDYYMTYYKDLKKYPEAITNIDKLLAMGDKIDAGTRLTALVYRAQSYLADSGDKALQTPDLLNKAKDAAAEGLKALDALQKPATATDAQFAASKTGVALIFDQAAGMAEAQLQDYKGSEAAYRAALALTPNDAVLHFRLGVDFLQENPKQWADGFWELSRSIAMKGPSQAQVQTYLRSQLLAYQQPGCEKLADDEINQWITLAGTTADRPATLTIPSAKDLESARDDIGNFINWLQEGGAHGQTMWLAVCGLEYPEVPVRVMEVTPGDGDNLTLKVYRPAAADPQAAQTEMDAATAPNMEVHIAGQPEAKRVMKDDDVRFTGTLTAYQQTPFLLTWEMAKVNPDDIPAEGKPAAPGGRRGAGAAPKAPAARRGASQ